MSTWTVSQARASLPEILARVAEGDEATLTRHGQPVAVIVRPDRVHVRRASAAAAIAEGKRLGEQLSAARLLTERPAGGLSVERAEELIAEIRTGRDAG